MTHEKDNSDKKPMADSVPDEGLTDQLSDELTASGQDTLVFQTDANQDIALEEEQVKDEIDIQIDLLKDPN